MNRKQLNNSALLKLIGLLVSNLERFRKNDKKVLIILRAYPTTLWFKQKRSSLVLEL